MTLIEIESLLRNACSVAPDTSNLRSVSTALVTFGPKAGLHKPWRFVHYGAQLMHETLCFKWDREIWGPTSAQLSYEGRKNLGNTRPGDGKRFMGRGPIQLTGRDNYTAFTSFTRSLDPRSPDFTVHPDLVNTDPWEGLTAIWYWSARKLNVLADRNDYEMITKRINGGLNGYQDRLRYLDRLSLVTLGYNANGVRTFQTDFSRRHGLVVDGLSGAKTRAALHAELRELV